MATLGDKTPKNTYKDLLQISNLNSGVDSALRRVEDGSGEETSLSLSTTAAEVDGTIAAKNILTYIAPEKFDAKGDAVGNEDGVVSGSTFQAASYHFGSVRAGQTLHCFGQTAVVESVNNGILELDRPLVDGTNRPWFIGNDDTAAFEAALQEATNVGASVGSSASDRNSYGPMPFGGVVHLRPGRGYYVKNTQARYDSGKLGAITVPKRCGLRGGGKGQSHIYLGYGHEGVAGNIGHGIANAGAGLAGGGFDDFMQLQDLAIFGSYDFQTDACLDGVFFNAAFDGYFKTDNYALMSNIVVFEARRDGFRFTGRGEGVFDNLFAYSCLRYGLHIYALVDSRFRTCNAGGNKKTGIRISNSPNTHLTNSKSFYNGGAGGSDPADCANFALLADQYLNGQVHMTACEAQESRGSSYYIQSGLNMLIGCLASDPGRTVLGGGTLPAVMAGFHFAGANASYNIVTGGHVRAALELDYGNPNNPAMYTGTHAVFLEQGCKENKGNIEVFTNSGFTVAKIGGETLDGNNTRLIIDGAILPSNVPSAITDLTALSRNGYIRLNWTRPSARGAAISGNLIEMNSGSGWSTVSTAGDVTTYDILPATNGTLYSIRVSPINSVGTATASNIAQAQPGPAIAMNDLPNLAFWIDASDASSISHVAGKVSQINDKSGNNRHATQPNASKQLTTGTRDLGGKNVLYCKNGSLILPSSLYSIPSANSTTVMVIQMDVTTKVPARALSGKSGSNTTYAILLFGSLSMRIRNCLSTSEASYFTSLNTSPHVVGLRRSGTSQRPIYDGLRAGNTLATNQTLTELLIGHDAAGTATQDFDGVFGEMGTFSDAKSDIEISKLVDSLMLKWGIIAENPPVIVGGQFDFSNPDNSALAALL